MRKAWPFAFYALQFAGIASVSPFVVLYCQEMGFTGAQIGVLAGAMPLVTMLSAPLWTSLADATRRHRLAMGLALLLGASALSALPFLRSFAPIVVLALLMNLFLAPVTSFADSATMFMLADRTDLYGRVRLGGTLGFGLAAPLAGALVQLHGLRVAFWVSATFFALAFLVSRKMVYGPAQKSGSTRGGARGLLANPRWLVFLVVALAGGAALAVVNNYFFPYLRELGSNESTMGMSLAIGTLSEVPVLFFASQLIRRLRAYGLLMLAMAITGVRLLLFAASATVGQALLVQILSGLTFPAMWIASVSYADENAPLGVKATAQGLLGAMVFGLGTAVGGFAGGPLVASLGGRGLYLVSAIFVLAVVFAAALIYRRLPPSRPARQGSLIGESSHD